METRRKPSIFAFPYFGGPKGYIWDALYSRWLLDVSFHRQTLTSLAMSSSHVCIEYQARQCMSHAPTPRPSRSLNKPFDSRLQGPRTSFPVEASLVLASTEASHLFCPRKHCCPVCDFPKLNKGICPPFHTSMIHLETWDLVGVILKIQSSKVETPNPWNHRQKHRNGPLRCWWFQGGFVYPRKYWTLRLFTMRSLFSFIEIGLDLRF